jgi:hypothetical protein
MSASVIRDWPQNPHITINTEHKILPNTIVFISNDTGCFIVSENISRKQSYKHSCCHNFKEHNVFPQVLITDKVAVAETPTIYRISTQLCHRTHSAYLQPHLHPALPQTSFCPLAKASPPRPATELTLPTYHRISTQLCHRTHSAHLPTHLHLALPENSLCPLATASPPNSAIELTLPTCHRISTQLCQRTHSAHLPVLFRGLTFCKFHHFVEPCVLRHCDVQAELRCQVRSDPQGVRYRYLYSSETTINVFQNILCVRGGRNCQNDEAKEKKPHAGIYGRLLEFEELRSVTGSGSGATLNVRVVMSGDNARSDVTVTRRKQTWRRSQWSYPLIYIQIRFDQYAN